MTKYFYLYQITNKLNGKIYIGVHKTTDLDDGYMGSGTYLRAAKEKYGIANFEKTILAFFDTKEEMFLAETNLVNDEFLSRADVYNLVRGGLSHGFDYVNERGLNLYGLNGSSGHGLENLYGQNKKLRDALIATGKWDSYCLKMSESLLALYAAGYVNPFKDKKHSVETKARIGSKNSILQTGAGNSQFGTMWITNEIESIKISKTDLVPDGWRKGRVIKQK